MGNTTVIERWWLVTFASLIIVMVLFLNHSPPSNSISVLQNVTMPITASNQLTMATMQSPISPNMVEELPGKSKLQPCIPLAEYKDVNDTPSPQIPSSGLPNSETSEKPTNLVDVPATSGLPHAQQSELTEKTEAAAAEAATTATTTTPNSSQSQFPASDVQKVQEESNKVDEEEPIAEEKEEKTCNIFEGKWVYDPREMPLYDAAMCPFFSATASCRRNGRPDREYERWRWEANDCNIPRFNAKDMLERLRGKRVVIVGDSINHSQFESLACLLYSAIPDQSYFDARDRVFRAESYNMEIQNYWAEFLVETLVNKTDGKKTLKLDSLASTAWKWKDADIMLFNTGHWWSNRKRWDLFQYKRKVFVDMKIETAFKVAMKTWARWIERNVDTSKTTVFFRGMSPAHFGTTWCYKVTRPVTDVNYHTTFGLKLKEIVEKTIQGMRTPVKYLNITKLSDSRPDAHSSIYATKQGKLLIATKQKPPALVADCSHWCLPGVPDTWNHLLYATMVFDSSRGVASTA